MNNPDKVQSNKVSDCNTTNAKKKNHGTHFFQKCVFVEFERYNKNIKKEFQLDVHSTYTCVYNKNVHISKKEFQIDWYLRTYVDCQFFFEFEP